MSKLDKQLDQVSGERPVVIRWLHDDEVDVNQLRQRLRDEIDSHRARIPLDLRQVDGVPPALVQLLVESQKYARSKDKLLSISSALPPIQQALNPRRRRKLGRPDEAIDGGDAVDASQVARSLLDARHDDEKAYDISKAEKIDRRKSITKVRKRSSGRKDFAKLGVAILLGAALLGVIEGFIIFRHEPALKVNVTDKSFEDEGSVSQSPTSAGFRD